MESTIHARRAVEALSPITREFFNRLALLEHQAISNAEKLAIQAEMAQVLTPEQRAIVEREALAAAIELQHALPSRGNRAERRKVKRNMRKMEKRT